MVEVLLHSGGDAAGAQSAGELVFLTSGHPEDENSFDHPTKVVPRAASVDGISDKFIIPLEPWSVNVLQIHLAAGPAVKISTAAAAAGAAKSSA